MAVSRSRAVAGVLVAWLLAGPWGAAETPAQFGGRPRARPAARPARIEVKGTLAMMGRGVLGVTTAAGELWRVQLARNAKVQVLGTATPAVLQPGQYIWFTAEVDKRRAAVQGKVAKLTIFTPSEQRGVGVFPEQGGLGLGGLDPGLGGEPAKPGRGRRPSPVADTGPPVEPFEIGAQIRGIKAGKLTLFAPNAYFRPAFEIELADEPEILVDVAGPNYLMLAQPGDAVEARGIQVGPNMAQVTEVILQLAQPLGLKQEPKRPARRPARSGRRPAVRPPGSEETGGEGPQKDGQTKEDPGR